MTVAELTDRIAEAIEHLNSGTTPSARYVSGGVVVEARGRLLMAYSDFAYQGWHFPKGGLDEGESSLEGALREVSEETGGVVAKQAKSQTIFELKPGRPYNEPIGFGSPRGEDLERRSSHKMSLGAAKLLDDAAVEAWIDPELYKTYRYDVFDELVRRRVRVWWMTVPTYHLLVYQEGVAVPTQDTDAVEWHFPQDILDLKPPGPKRSRSKMSGAVRTILEWPDFKSAIDKARKEAADAGDVVE
ncbi:MAG: NUDIX hydrolase [Zavarzinella sp.]